MNNDTFAELFDAGTCAELLPADTADQFFDALFGDVDEGSFDLQLSYRGSDHDTLVFDILLLERPNHCLACNLTYGLPQVFSRHPVINIGGLVEKIGAIIAERAVPGEWKLGPTTERSRSLHSIPLIIELKQPQ